MHSSWPAFLFVIGALVLISVFFLKKPKDEEFLIASQGKIALVVLHDCVMLNHFTTIRALSNRYRFDATQLECVLEDFVSYGMFEKRYRKRLSPFEVALYRRKLGTAEIDFYTQSEIASKSNTI